MAGKVAGRAAGGDAAHEPVDWKAFGPGPIIGVDEVGRGCLAGPVYACAAILPDEFPVTGVTDSKLLSERRRERLAAEISAHARVCIGIASEDEIAALNILRASLLAMRRAIDGLGVEVGHALIDGNQRVPGLSPGILQTTIVKGDLRATPIGAAAIVAKVARDRLMAEIGELYPEYGFASNKGYGSALHLAGIAEHGPCVRHRREFAGVREHWHRLRPEAIALRNRLAVGADRGSLAREEGL